MSAAPLRTFVVFRDDAPSSPTSSVSSLSAIDSALRASSPTPLSPPDKENINPVTGRKAPSDAPPAKKRKEGALSTKSYAPAPVKKTKESKSSRSFGTAISKSKAPAAPSKRPTTARRTTAPSRSRRTPALPPVNEEQAVEAEPNVPHARPLTQTQIDARCYELTVLPLADLSKAYEQSPCLEGEHSLEEKLRPEVSKEVAHDTKSKESTQLKDSTKPKDSVDTESQDIKSAVESGSDRAPSPAPSTVRSRSPSPECRGSSSSAFSTPERKRIYSAFTFSTPSPSSVRFAALRGSNETRFSDPALEL